MVGSSVTSEAVLFYDHKGIGKSMLYSDFEAILDGMVGVPDFTNKAIRAAYCQVNGRLQIKAMVLFLIDFDGDGMADAGWNIPLRHLAEHGGPGPDMGAGPIRLACRSQCSVAWHQHQLWDPQIKPGANDFVGARDLLRARGAKLGLEMDDPLTSPGVPTLSEQEEAARQTPDVGFSEENGDHEPVRLARTIRELHLQIQTLEAGQKEEVAQLRYAQQQKEEILGAQLKKVLMQFKTLKSQNAALRQQNDSLKTQVEALNQSLGQNDEQDSEKQRLAERYQLTLEHRLEEERAYLAEKIHSLEMDVLSRDGLINQLCTEVTELQRDQQKVAHSGGQKVLDKLEELGLSFTAFHPGAGYVSVTAEQITDYMENPMAFAAGKCLVTEDHYRAWLAHYENPVCQVPLGPDQTPCGRRVIRIEVPNQFKSGISDCNANRCHHCRSDSSIDRVLKSR